MPASRPDRQLLSRRWVYRTLREVYLEDGREVVKRFVHHAGRHDRRRVWEREDLALRRLEGLAVPQTLGYVQGVCADGPEFVLRKEYIAGTPLRQPTSRDAVDMARLLARIHERAVVTGDPALNNFLRGSNGTLYFIDFGRARTFRMRTLMFYLYVGKDLARLYRTGLQGQQSFWTAFEQAYRATFHPRPLPRRLIQLSFRYWLHRWRRRPHSNPPRREVAA